MRHTAAVLSPSCCQVGWLEVKTQAVQQVPKPQSLHASNNSTMAAVLDGWAEVPQASQYAHAFTLFAPSPASSLKHTPPRLPSFRPRLGSLSRPL